MISDDFKEIGKETHSLQKQTQLHLMAKKEESHLIFLMKVIRVMIIQLERKIEGKSLRRHQEQLVL